MKNSQNSRLLPLEKGTNFRDLGGYLASNGQSVKWHKLIRSASLSYLTQQDQSFLKEYGLKTIVDFRSPEEATEEPDISIDGVKHIFMPVFEVDETKNSISPTQLFNDLLKNPDGEAQMIRVNQNLVSEPHSISAYRNFLQLLLKNNVDNQSVLFHCTAGKDRTGFGAVLILSILGVPKETIMEDYLLSSQYSIEAKEKTLDFLRKENASQSIIDGVTDLLEVKPQYLQAAYDTIDKNYGGMANYLVNEMQIDDAMTNKFKKIYLE